MLQRQSVTGIRLLANIRIRFAAATLLMALVTTLSGCIDPPLPEGWKIARISKAKEPGQQCPDLVGIWTPGRTAWLEEFLEKKLPAGSSTDFVSITAAGTGYNLVWHSNRAAFLDEAKRFALRDPDRYHAWRGMTIRQGQPPGTNRFGSSKPEDLSLLGPVFRQSVSLPMRRCDRHWQLVNYKTETSITATSSDGRPREQDVELWLARGEDGALIMKRVTYDLYHYSIYAGTNSSLRTGSRTTHDKWTKAPFQDASPIRAEELPEVEDPVARRQRCKLTPEHFVEFNQRLLRQMPRAAALTLFEPAQLQGRARQDGQCDPSVLTLEFSVGNPEAIDAITTILQADPLVAEVGRPQALPSHRGGVRHRYRLMVRPPT